MSSTYPTDIYPKPVRTELDRFQQQQIEIAAQLESLAFPSKPTFLVNAPWYFAIIALATISLLVYQVFSPPLLMLLGGAAVGLAIKCVVDHHRWHKRFIAAKQRQTALAAINLPYPNWQKILKPQISTVRSTAAIGTSEEFFLEHLKRYFTTAEQGHAFPIPNSEYQYSSDIEIHLKDHDLFIQIEIDEPYVGETGPPHHCVDVEKDTKRDKFFSDRGWIVIRFAEEQVVCQPKACSAFIAQKICALTGDKKYIVAVGSTEAIKPIPRWSTQEAQKMAENKYRWKYLVPAGLWKLPPSAEQKPILRRKSN